MESVSKTVNNITVTVDYRTELLGILMYISGYDEFCPIQYDKGYPNDEYIDNIRKKFSKYKDEDVVRKFISLCKKHGFSYDAPICMFLQLDDNFKCDCLDDYIFKERLHSDDTVYDLIKGLNEFASKINFNNYYDSNKKQYSEYIDKVAKCFNELDINKYLSDYYGYDENKKFFVNLLPFATIGGYNATLSDSIYSNITVDDKEEMFKVKFAPGLITLTVHEMSHGYINPITDRLNLVDEKDNLFDDIKDVMANMAYTSNKDIINEHIIRAIEIRTIKNVFQNDSWHERRLEHEKNNGFIYIDVVEKSLEDYELNRDRYHKFDDFYPIIIENIKTSKKQSLKRM